MNNYEEQTKETSTKGYATVTYPHEGGITTFDIPCQTGDRPSCNEDSELIAKFNNP